MSTYKRCTYIYTALVYIYIYVCVCVCTVPVYECVAEVPAMTQAACYKFAVLSTYLDDAGSGSSGYIAPGAPHPVEADATP